MTTATDIATRYHDDGQCWYVDGVHIEDVCEAASVACAQSAMMTRYCFADGSVIICTGDWWDVGMSPGCYCIDSHGHRDACELYAHETDAYGNPLHMEAV